MATPVTSAQVAKAWVRPDRRLAAVSWSRRLVQLMGVFGPVVEALVLTMLDPGHDLPLGSGVALQLVGDEHTRGSTLLLEELAEQPFGGLLVAPALDENIENEAV